MQPSIAVALRIFSPPTFRPLLAHARTAATTHRRAAADSRPPLLKSMPRRIKRPERRQKKMYWKNWWLKNTTTRELTEEQTMVLEEVTAETARAAAAVSKPSVKDTNIDGLSVQLEARLEINKADNIPERFSNNEILSRSTSFQPPYSVSRTGSGNLPTYQLLKAGGSLLQTRIRRIRGTATDLRDELSKWLQPPPQWLRVNTVNGHIEIKGWYKNQVDSYLLAKGF